MNTDADQLWAHHRQRMLRWIIRLAFVPVLLAALLQVISGSSIVYRLMPHEQATEDPAAHVAERSEEPLGSGITLPSPGR